MSWKIPLGEREGLTLEFKGQEILRRPHRIAREVVAFLNAAGGRVWIGIEEEGGAAARVKGIADIEACRARLRDHLLDTIEPAPGANEVEVRVVKDDQGGAVLVVVVSVDRNQRRGPYAMLHEGGRHYVIRFDDRTRPMERDEIAMRFGENRGSEQATKEDTSKLLLQRLREDNENRRFSGMWLGLRPDRDLDLRVDSALGREYLDPTRTGNRRMGWGYTGSVTEIKTLPRGIQFSRANSIRTDVLETGEIYFRAPMEALRHGTPADKKEIHPLALVEFPTSVLRLASSILGVAEAAGADFVFATMALLGVEGYLLLPFSPGAHGYRLSHPGCDHQPRYDRGKDLVVEPPLSFRREEITKEPDRCALRLLIKVYRSFGYEEELLPREFDRATGRLLLAD